MSTGRQVAIKKIKVGQFKDGLDMSAIREVKYLRELKHQNVIETHIRQAERCEGPSNRPSACQSLHELRDRVVVYLGRQNTRSIGDSRYS